MRLRLLKCSLPLAGALGMVVGSVASTEAAPLYSYTGCISTVSTECAGGDLVTDDGWAYAKLSWLVTQETAADPWVYSYTFTRETAGGPTNPGVSHTIVELSTVFTEADLTGTANCNEPEIDTYSAGPSNPELPGEIYGLKCGHPEANPLSWTITTFRAPVWGDFYAKGGNTTEAWNAGFLLTDPTDAPANGSLNDHILRPDTTTTPCTSNCGGTPTPEPASLALFGLAASALAFARRRRTL